MTYYSIIYADPPWSYDHQETDPKRGGMTYPTLSIEDICKLNVSSIANENSALFLWGTWPKLKQAFSVIDAWGFEYRTVAFVWVKQNPKGTGIYSGMGYWTNGNTEFVLFAKRGSPKRVSKSVKQVIIAPRSRHSEKPSEVRTRIVQLMGNLPRIELFARMRVDGWDAIGYDIDKTDIRMVL